MSSYQVQALSEFVRNCKTQPNTLFRPEFSFLKQWLESLGARIPQSNSSGSCSEATDGSDDPESDLDIDTDGVVVGDADPPQEMGNELLEVSESMMALSDTKRDEARTALSNGRYADAAYSLTRAIKNNPTSSQLYTMRASAYIGMKKPNAAIRDCNKALELNSESGEAYKWRGQANKLLGHWEDSFRDLNTSCRLDFDDETSAMLREVEPKARRVIEHRRKYERKREEKELAERREKLRRLKETLDDEQRNAGVAGRPARSRLAGSPVIAYLPNLLSDPDLLRSFQDPEILEAFADISETPSNMYKYKDLPKIQNLVLQMQVKFGCPSSNDHGIDTL